MPKVAQSNRHVRVLEHRDFAPLLAVGGALILTIASATVSKLFDRFTDALAERFSPYVDLSVKMNTVDVYSDKIFNIIRDCFNTITFIETDQDPSGLNVSEESFKRAIINSAKATIMLTTLVSDDAGEIAMESISESLTNAVYAGLTGAISAQVNYRVGLIPPSGLLGDEALFLDTRTRAIIDAFAGQLLHYTIAHEAIRRARTAQQIWNKMSILDHAGATLETALAFKLTQLAEMHHILRTAITRLVEEVRNALFILLRRVNDVMLDVEIAYASYNTIINNKRLLPENKALVILKSAEIELDKINEEITKLVEDVEHVVQNMPLSMYHEGLENVVDDLEYVYGRFVDSTILSDWQTYVETLASIRKYVHVKDVRFSIINPASGTENWISIEQ